MQTKEGAKCPFAFNLDPATFKVGDLVSYRVDGMNEFPFMGLLVEVHDDYVVISSGDPSDTQRRMRGTRESRPRVSHSEALG